MTEKHNPSFVEVFEFLDRHLEARAEGSAFSEYADALIAKYDCSARDAIYAVQQWTKHRFYK